MLVKNTSTTYLPLFTNGTHQWSMRPKRHNTARQDQFQYTFTDRDTTSFTSTESSSSGTISRTSSTTIQPKLQKQLNKMALLETRIKQLQEENHTLKKEMAKAALALGFTQGKSFNKLFLEHSTNKKTLTLLKQEMREIKQIPEVSPYLQEKVKRSHAAQYETSDSGLCAEMLHASLPS